MKYNKGDRVRIKSIDWYNKNKTAHGDIWFDNAVFVGGQSLYCGCELTICLVAYNSYYVIENDYYWTDEMIEGLVEEETKLETKFGTASNPLDPKSNANCLTQERVDELTTKIDKELPSVNQNVWELPDGYQFVDENGNLINVTKIFLEKKKKEYPESYEECLKVLGYDDREVYSILHTGADERLFDALYCLKVCRDAYWKIAGDEMGLNRPWEPNWEDSLEVKYCITVSENKITMPFTRIKNRILVFPTEEMRDAFYENFKKEIEICKTLL